MVKVPDEIIKISTDYINRIKIMIPVEKAFLFGSYAKGNYTKNSDLDIAVFSPAFENMTRIDGLILLLSPALEYKADIQPQPFTMQDYNDNSGIMDEIKRTGIELV